MVKLQKGVNLKKRTQKVKVDIRKYIPVVSKEYLLKK